MDYLRTRDFEEEEEEEGEDLLFLPTKGSEYRGRKIKRKVQIALDR